MDGVQNMSERQNADFNVSTVIDDDIDWACGVVAQYGTSHNSDAIILVEIHLYQPKVLL